MHLFVESSGMMTFYSGTIALMPLIQALYNSGHFFVRTQYTSIITSVLIIATLYFYFVHRPSWLLLACACCCSAASSRCWWGQHSRGATAGASVCGRYDAIIGHTAQQAQQRAQQQRAAEVASRLRTEAAAEQQRHQQQRTAEHVHTAAAARTNASSICFLQ